MAAQTVLELSNNLELELWLGLELGVLKEPMIHNGKLGWAEFTMVKGKPASE